MRKSHKMILSLYIVLLMSLSMLCIHCKAYQYEDNMSATFIATTTMDGGGTDIGQITLSQDFSQNQNNRGVFMHFSEELLNELYTDPSFRTSLSNGYVYFSKRSQGPSVESHTISTDIYVSAIVWQYQSVIDAYIQRETGLDIENFCIFGASVPVDNGNKMIFTQVELQSDSIEYVDNLNDLKAFFQGDDSVVKNGDPGNNEIIDENGNIPTPQTVKLYNDGQCVGLVWDNPKLINKLVGKYGDVSVEIKFRPTLNYNLDLFRSKTLTPTDYIGGITSTLSDHGSLYNGFMTMFSNRSTVSNKLDKYNIKFDNHYIFTDNILDTDYANMVCKMLGHKLWYVPDSLLDAVLPATRGGTLPANTLAGEMTDKKSKGVKAGEGGSAVDVGLKVLDSLGNLSDFASNVKELMNNVTVGHSDYMIRYYMMDGNKKLCSKWVNVNQTYDDNASATDEQSTNFKDVENNPVDNPNYNYPSSTSISSSTGDSWWTHFDDSTKTVFDSLSEQMEQLTESDGGFMQFFGELFATFPWLAGIFMLALSIALFLRIFGR